MPAYPSTQPRALYPGQQVALINNAATDSGVTTTIQAAFGFSPGNVESNWLLFNTTDQTATVEVAASDANADYLQLTTSVTVAASKAVAFSCGAPWIRCTFSVAPASGSLILYRA